MSPYHLMIHYNISNLLNIDFAHIYNFSSVHMLGDLESALGEYFIVG